MAKWGEIIHQVAGRIRVRIARSAILQGECDAIRLGLQTQPGVQRVRVNRDCQSVIVHFDPQVISVADLCESGIASIMAAPENGSTSPLHPLPYGQRVASSSSALRVCDIGSNRWHAVTSAEVAEHWKVAPERGLRQRDAQQRLRSYGTNALEQVTPRAKLGIWWNQFNSLPVALLVGSAVISIATGGIADAVVIMSVVGINGVIGYVTESQAEKTINALMEQNLASATVLRDRQPQMLVADQVVPGDVLLLAPGQIVPADARLIDAQRLSVDQSTLTGESMPAVKGVDCLPERVPLGSRQNMVHRGSVVTGGSGTAIVVATGHLTEVGKIHYLVGTARPPETPMQRQLSHLGTTLGLATGAICASVFVMGLLRSIGWVEMLKSACSLAVAAVPEGLPMVATTTLVLGVRRMRQRQVIVRRLDAIETLGSVQVLCLDKTGTLTMNRMVVDSLLVGMQRWHVCEDPERGRLLVQEHRPRQQPEESQSPHPEDLTWMLRSMVLCNETELHASSTAEHGWRFVGSPTETAMIELALDLGVDIGAERANHPLLETQYRTEQLSYMCTRHQREPDSPVVCVKGRPTEVLELCPLQMRQGKARPLTPHDRRAIVAENERMAGEALRVLGVAYQAKEHGDRLRQGEFVWLGLVGIADPIRPGMAELMGRFHRAGIRTMMITGDQNATAYAVGRSLHLNGAQGLNMVDAGQLEQVDPQVLSGLVQNAHIFSAVGPSHKLQIVQALQQSGLVVAMTGDGINDGPALKAADVGVAMGGDQGTELARTTADIVLLDNNLATMIVAIGEGRALLDNIRKAINYLLATNMSETAVVFSSLAAGVGSPLNPMQLLWINLVSDVFPVLALAVQPAEEDVLNRPPRQRDASLLQRSDFAAIARQTLLLTASTLGSYGYGRYRHGPGAQASTIAFHTLTAAQLFHMWSARSDRPDMFERPQGSNWWLLGALAGGLGLQLATAIVPPLRRLLKNAPLGLLDWGVSLLGAALPLLLNEQFKYAASPSLPQE